MIKNILLSIFSLLVLFTFSLFMPDQSQAQTVDSGKVSGKVQWNGTNISVQGNIKFEGVNSGFTYTTILFKGANNIQSFNSGFNLPPDTYTVTLTVTSADYSQAYVADTKSVTVDAGQAVTEDFDLSSVLGLVQGSFKVNGVNSDGYIQFCPPSPAACPIAPENGYPFSTQYGPFFNFGSGYYGYNGFNIPLPAGNYQAHVVTLGGSDAGIVPITVSQGQITNNSGLQFQLNQGKIAGKVQWSSSNLSIKGNVKFEGVNTGYTYTTILLKDANNVQTYDSGFTLPPDTYTTTLTVTSADYSTAYVADTKTVVVSSGQTVTTDFDLSNNLGHVQGNLNLNGVSSDGYVQFCPPSPAVCPLAPLNGYPFSPEHGSFYNFGFSYYGFNGFSIPLPAGQYQAHIVTLSGEDVCTENVTVSSSNSVTINSCTYPPQNHDPIVETITPSVLTLPINTNLSVTATFSDVDTADTHTATIAWGDTSTTPGSVNESAKTVQGSHPYTTPGVYPVTVTVYDNHNGSGFKEYDYIIVITPNQSKVVGSKSFTSPAGAFPQNVGEVSFGFKGDYTNSVFSGSGSMSFGQGNNKIDFTAHDADWMTVNGNMVNFQATGSVKKSNDTYVMFVSAVDNGAANTGLDTVRVRLIDITTNKVVYDSQPNTPLTTIPTTNIASPGDIKIN